MTRHFKPSALINPNGAKPKALKPKGPKPNDANRVRIIGGQWRSRVIEFSGGEGLRPTANRVRETLFNWLGQTLHEKRCLDLFAGSGALGFEAASRGATEVVMVENSRTAMLALKKNQEKLEATQCRVLLSDAQDFLAKNKNPFDIIFLDPPFGSDLMTPLLNKLPGHLAENAVVYAEWREPLATMLSTVSQTRWQLLKQGKAGAVHFGLLSIAQGAT